MQPPAGSAERPGGGTAGVDTGESSTRGRRAWAYRKGDMMSVSTLLYIATRLARITQANACHVTGHSSARARTQRTSSELAHTWAPIASPHLSTPAPCTRMRMYARHYERDAPQPGRRRRRGERKMWLTGTGTARGAALPARRRLAPLLATAPTLARARQVAGGEEHSEPRAEGVARATPGPGPLRHLAACQPPHTRRQRRLRPATLPRNPPHVWQSGNRCADRRAVVPDSQGKARKVQSSSTGYGYDDGRGMASEACRRRASCAGSQCGPAALCAGSPSQICS